MKPVLPELWSQRRETAAQPSRPWRQKNLWLCVRRHTDGHRHTCREGKRDNFRAASNSLNCTKPPENYAAFHFNFPTHSSSLRRLSITINNNSLNNAPSFQNMLHVLQLAFTPHFLSRALIQTPKERAQSQITKKLFHRLICFSLWHHNAAIQYIKKNWQTAW